MTNLKIGERVYFRDFLNNNAYRWSVGEIQLNKHGEFYIEHVKWVDDVMLLSKLDAGARIKPPESRKP